MQILNNCHEPTTKQALIYSQTRVGETVKGQISVAFFTTVISQHSAEVSDQTPAIKDEPRSTRHLWSPYLAYCF